MEITSHKPVMERADKMGLQHLEIDQVLAFLSGEQVPNTHRSHIPSHRKLLPLNH